jgi:FkbM family methyltransferase
VGRAYGERRSSEEPTGVIRWVYVRRCRRSDAVYVRSDAVIRRLGRIAAAHPRTRRIFEGIYLVATPSVAFIKSGPAAGMQIRTRSGNAGYRFGTTEPLVQQALADSLEPGLVCYDLGANVGFFTLLAANIVGQTGFVYAAEPMPTVATELRENVALNSLANVEIVEAAICDKVGEATLFEGATELNARLDYKPGRKALPPVKTTTVDALVQAGKRPPDVVKIDVEGAEFAVLRGMVNTISSRHPTLIIEVHQQGLLAQSQRALVASLPDSYDVVPLEGVPVDEEVWVPHFVAQPKR